MVCKWTQTELKEKLIRMKDNGALQRLYNKYKSEIYPMGTCILCLRLIDRNIENILILVKAIKFTR